ncbi:unnamed protein product [Symbiodinium sp. CCMP2456]|nr:unnamed protein product [Symbiodinium sp. CCMP2456]
MSPLVLLISILVGCSGTHNEAISTATQGTSLAPQKPQSEDLCENLSACRGVRVDTASGLEAPTGDQVAAQSPLQQYDERATMAVRMRKHGQSHRCLLWAVWLSVVVYDTRYEATLATQLGQCDVGEADGLSSPPLWSRRLGEGTRQRQGCQIEGTTATPASSSTAGSPAETALQALLHALSRNRDELPENLREVLDTHAEADHRAQTKSMHRLVATQSQAKRELAAARKARQDYLRDWSSYVDGLCSLWQGHIEEKAKAMDAFSEAEKQWELQLSGATNQLKQLATEESKETIDVEGMEEDEEEELLSDLAQQDAQRQVALDNIAMTEQRISESLQEASRSAAQQVAAFTSERERSPRRRGNQPTKKEEVKEAGAAKGKAAEPPPPATHGYQIPVKRRTLVRMRPPVLKWRMSAIKEPSETRKGPPLWEQ